MSTPAHALLNELDVLHRDLVFPATFAQLKWYMVSTHETELSRRDGVIFINKTTFWVSPDRNPNGQACIQFDAVDSEKMGKHISDDAFTAACGKSGDAEIIIGIAPQERQVEDAIRRHEHTMAAAYEPDGTKHTPRSMRARRRARKTGRP